MTIFLNSNGSKISYAIGYYERYIKLDSSYASGCSSNSKSLYRST